ncbi:MAG: phosphatidylserine/phosphatidylglycerophosphate/cardiolipin synthase family protein [Deinococcus sp.]|nr:phosphatidylserine/phosphatidylglycerophosphate/cardiolipin synthase family protein [Deinococcus sp.]
MWWAQPQRGDYGGRPLIKTTRSRKFSADALEPRRRPVMAPACTKGNWVRALFDSRDIFPALRQALASADRTIRLDFYIFGGRQGQELAELLVRQVRAGVAVRVMLDRNLGTIPQVRQVTLPVLNYLLAEGVPVVLSSGRYSLLSPARGVDHNKYVVVDGARALVGGANIADLYETFHDLMLQVEGPAARELARQFDRDWRRACRTVPPLAEGDGRVAPVYPDGVAVRVLTAGDGQGTLRQAVLAALAAARQSIYVSMLELGHAEAINGLVAAWRRGVDVRVLLDPGDFADLVPVVRWAPRGILNAHTVRQLVEAAVPVRLFKVDQQLSTLHTKLAVFDSRRLLAGSSNWTSKGFGYMLETNVEVRGGEAVAQVERRFLQDWQQRGEVPELPGLLSRGANWLYRRLL